MSMPQHCRRTASTFLLLLLLAVPALHAAPHGRGVQTDLQPAAATSPVRSLLQAVWNLWTAGWSAVTAETDPGSLDDAGARIDGNGIVDLAVVGIDDEGDAGARIDGNGAR
jgi:hypothetical protein